MRLTMIKLPRILLLVGVSGLMMMSAAFTAAADTQKLAFTIYNDTDEKVTLAIGNMQNLGDMDCGTLDNPTKIPAGKSEKCTILFTNNRYQQGRLVIKIIDHTDSKKILAEGWYDYVLQEIDNNLFKYMKFHEEHQRISSPYTVSFPTPGGYDPEGTCSMDGKRKDKQRCSLDQDIRIQQSSVHKK